MKLSTLRTYVCTPLLLLLIAGGSVHAQNSGDPPSLPPTLTLALELETLPGLKSPGSYWEASYQWRIADQREFDRWSDGGENSESRIGTLLSKNSFRRENLFLNQNRRYEVSVPITSELLRQQRKAGGRPQVLWLDATMRIHDAALGTDVVKKINPVWGPHSYRDGRASVRMELMPSGRLRWFITPTPPWVTGQTHTTKSARKSQ